MKYAIVATIAVLLGTLPAQCRIGETLDQLTARFGEGRKNTGTIRLAGHDQYYFEKDGIGIECVMANDKCIMEVFHNLGPKITDQDIKELLKAEGESHGWGFNIAKKRWIRSDNKLQAYRLAGHDDFFSIEEISGRKPGDQPDTGKPGF